MTLYTTQSCAESAADRWVAQCVKYPGMADKTVIGDRLRALGAHPSPAAVNEVIGNESWTVLDCHECGKEVTAVVELGEEPDSESSTVQICASCLSDAASLAGG